MKHIIRLRVTTLISLQTTKQKYLDVGEGDGALAFPFAVDREDALSGFSGVAAAWTLLRVTLRSPSGTSDGCVLVDLRGILTYFLTKNIYNLK